MDSRAFLEAARAVLADSQWVAKGRISNDALFAAIETRLGVEKLPRRAWAKHLSSLGLKSAKWSSGVRGWRLPDTTVDATPDTTVDTTVDATVVDATVVVTVDVTVDATKSAPPVKYPKCRVRLPNPQAAGYITKEALLEGIRKHPGVRPCPKYNWWWIETEWCEKCDWLMMPVKR